MIKTIMRKSIIYKVLLPLLGLIAVIFYDTTTPIINGIIKLKVSFFGFFLEPLLQSAFDISLREAQILSAWIYLLIAIFIIWYFLRKVLLISLAIFYSVRRSWLTISRWQKMSLFLLAVLLVVVIGKTALMFI